MKRKLGSLRLITSLILVVCFLLHALRNSFAHAHQAKDASNFEASILKQHLVLTQKDPLDAYATNDLEKAKKKKNKSKAIGGRKLTISHHDEAEEEENHHDHHPKAEKKLSGSFKRYMLESSPKKLNSSLNQTKNKVLGTNPRSSNRVGQDEESEARKRIFEAEKEIMKLMRKDYAGGRMWKPRRKPPINNHIPKN